MIKEIDNSPLIPIPHSGDFDLLAAADLACPFEVADDGRLRIVSPYKSGLLSHYETVVTGGKFRKPPSIVMQHYTGAHSWLRTITQFQKDEAPRRSAHFVISQAGAVAQMLPVTHIAWHAGRTSKWTPPEEPLIYGLNFHSIGIEYVNTGLLSSKGDVLKTWWDTRRLA
jgi:N-acetyl-anhydromuramyl-L-alanine amidase AmpD